VGTLIPASLFCAKTVSRLTNGWSRNGVTIFLASLFVIPVLAFCFWFGLSNQSVIIAVLVVLAVFTYVWWKAVDFSAMAICSAILWVAVFGVFFPSLAVNEVPADILKIVGERNVFFFRDPQPAMLPILKKRSMEVVFNLTGVAQQCDQTPLVFSLREQSERLKSNATALNVKVSELYSYKAIIALEKLVSSAVRSSAGGKSQLAIKSRSLEPLKTEIVLFQVLCATGES
jgi:hypothetical protein